jgi:D-xylose transport system substrate-binding protein
MSLLQIPHAGRTLTTLGGALSLVLVVAACQTAAPAAPTAAPAAPTAAAKPTTPPAAVATTAPTVAAAAKPTAPATTVAAPAPTTAAAANGTASPTIALLLPNVDAPRYENQDRPKFTKALQQICPDCKLLYYNADNDQSKQQSQAESAITNGATVISLVPVDVKASASIAQYAHSKGVKIVSLGRLILDAPVDALVSYDPLVVGNQQATTLVAAMKSSGSASKQIVEINGAPTDDLAVGFKQGAHQILDTSGITIGREYDTPDWSPARSQQEMDQAITALGKDQIGGVLAANDSTAGAAVASLKNAGLDPHQIPITGLDADLAGLQRILTGEQLMTVYQPIQDAQTANAKLALALGQGKPLPSDVINGSRNNGAMDVPAYMYKTVIVTKDNMKQTVLAEENYVDVSQLCTPPYDTACKDAGIGSN